MNLLVEKLNLKQNIQQIQDMEKKLICSLYQKSYLKKSSFERHWISNHNEKNKYI